MTQDPITTRIARLEAEWEQAHDAAQPAFEDAYWLRTTAAETRYERLQAKADAIARELAAARRAARAAGLDPFANRTSPEAA